GNKDTTFEKSAIEEENEADEIFETEPPTDELEYIDEFLESPTSREISEAEFYLDEGQQANEEVPIQQAIPPVLFPEENMKTITSKLGYWNIRGRAEQIRILCIYIDENCIEETYTFGPGPKYKSEDWEQKKKSSAEYAGLVLPYWIEGDIRITGATEIMEHIAKKHDMWPLEKSVKKNLRKIYIKINELRSALEDFSNDKNWINYPDFNLYDLLDMLRTLSPEILANH
ncbi:unnamed protein product, partial [Hymenolepis diminuta]